MTRPPLEPAALHRWGFRGAGVQPSEAFLAWLEARLGPAEALPEPVAPETIPVPEAGPLPDLPGLADDPLDRLAHARGRGLTDLLRLRSGRLPALPDAVVRPEDERVVETTLRRLAAGGVRAIPWGGGTSVTGGVNVVPDDRPAVVVDLGRLDRAIDIDPLSGLATFGAGIRGPALEAALESQGRTLGHFPQSWELSTLGGWIATRASGQESLGYGSIHDLVAGLRLVAPAGRLALAAQPASAAGPDLRQLVLGSEGRLGIVTSATVRTAPRPEDRQAVGLLLPDEESGRAAVRDLVLGVRGLSMIRLSDAAETEVAVALGLAGHRWLGRVVDLYRGLRGVGSGACLLLVGAAGGEAEVDAALAEATEVTRRRGGVSLGRAPGRKWLADRFRHPYLRDALLDRGVATDTLETAAPWSRLDAVATSVREALANAAERQGEGIATLCHISHPYPDGASLYFTLFFRCPADVDEAAELWADLKRRATDALLAAGGTLSHHHGVGSWHAPWLTAEIGSSGRRLLAAAAREMDPDGLLNPHVLLDPEDRLTL